MKQLDYGKGNIAKNIIGSAIPMLVAQLINLLYNLTDRVYIGRIPHIGTRTLGAIGMTFPVIILITAFTNLYSGGGATLFAISRGSGDDKRAKKLINLTFVLEVCSAIILMVAGIVFADVILTAFRTSDDNMIYSLPYLRIYLTGTVFAMVSIGMNPFINAQGFPSIGMISVIIGALANLILDPLFIFPMGLGVNGAAIATVISQFISACFVVVTLMNKKMPIRLSPLSIFNMIRPHKEKRVKSKAPDTLRLIADIVTLGVASFVMQFTNSLVSLICNAVLSKTGGDIYISVMTIVSSLRQVFETPILAICEGSSPVVSYNYGAKSYDRVRMSIRMMSYMSLGYTFVIWLLLMIFPHAFIAIFSSDKTILADTMSATRIYFGAFLFMTLQYIGQTSYKALNKKKQSIFFSIFRKVIIVVPLTLILPFFISPAVNGVFYAEPVSNIIGGSASFFTMLYAVKKL